MMFHQVLSALFDKSVNWFKSVTVAIQPSHPFLLSLLVSRRRLSGARMEWQT